VAPEPGPAPRAHCVELVAEGDRRRRLLRLGGQFAHSGGARDRLDELRAEQREELDLASHRAGQTRNRQQGDPRRPVALASANSHDDLSLDKKWDQLPVQRITAEHYPRLLAG
jgi:hypothetical protein